MQGVYGNHVAPSNTYLRSAGKQLFQHSVNGLGVLWVGPWTAGLMAPDRWDDAEVGIGHVANFDRIVLRRGVLVRD